MWTRRVVRSVGDERRCPWSSCTLYGPFTGSPRCVADGVELMNGERSWMASPSRRKTLGALAGVRSAVLALLYEFEARLMEARAVDDGKSSRSALEVLVNSNRSPSLARMAGAAHRSSQGFWTLRRRELPRSSMVLRVAFETREMRTMEGEGGLEARHCAPLYCPRYLLTVLTNSSEQTLCARHLPSTFSFELRVNVRQCRHGPF
jgi:hypothetical protein